jgi:hypothetical protein
MAEYGTELLRRQLNGKVLVRNVFGGALSVFLPLYRTNTFVPSEAATFVFLAVVVPLDSALFFMARSGELLRGFV